MFAEALSGEAEIRLTSRIVREMDPDVMVMNEVDSCAGRTGNRDHLKQNWEILSPERTTYPDARAMQTAGSSRDVPGKCIDYIMILKGSAEYEVVAADVPTDFKAGSVFEASDHLPVYVDVRF